MSGMIRSLARTRAKNNMMKKGMTRVCSKGKRKYSWFADNWRYYVVMGGTKK